MKQITKFLILTVLALALMGSTAVAFAHDGSGNMKRPGGSGRGIGGKVIAIDGNTISVENPRGTGTIVTDPDTTEFTVNGGAGKKIDDISLEMFVMAKGELSEDGTSVTATQVFASDELPQRHTDGEGRKRFPGMGGQVTAVTVNGDSGTIAVENPRGGSGTIVTNGSTEFTVNGEAGDISDIEVEMFVMAKGELSEDGTSLTASQLFASDELPQRPKDGQGQQPGRGQ